MKQLLLTLMAFASLIIGTRAQSDTAVIYPDLGSTVRSDGTWTQFIGKPIVVMRSHAEQFFIDSRAAFDAALDDEQVPSVTRINGIAWNKFTGHKDYNHDGLAFQGLSDKYVALYVAHADVIKNGYTFSDTNLGRPVITFGEAGPIASVEPEPVALGKSDYAKNVKSGKWRKFVNGQ
jgi:hypothetical protein